jgi:hypothetical protein
MGEPFHTSRLSGLLIFRQTGALHSSRIGLWMPWPGCPHTAQTLYSFDVDYARFVVDAKVSDVVYLCLLTKSRLN